RLAGPHIGPDHAVALGDLVGDGMDLVLELVFRRHVRHVEALAVDVELPAVIDAAQPAMLVPPVEQRGAAMRTFMVHDADAARTVAPGDQLFAEQHQAHRLAVGLEVARRDRRNPVPAHQLAHRRARPDAADEIVIGLRQHGGPLPRLFQHSRSERIANGVAWASAAATFLPFGHAPNLSRHAFAHSASSRSLSSVTTWRMRCWKKARARACMALL